LVTPAVEHNSQHGISRVKSDLLAAFIRYAGLWLHRVERAPDGDFVFVFLDPEHECEQLLTEFLEHSGVSDASALLQEFDFVRRQMKKLFKVEREEQD